MTLDELKAAASNAPASKKIGLAALREKAANKPDALMNTQKAITYNPNEMKDRIGIGFDDSGSMGRQKMQDAHAGVEEFLRCCNKDTTSICVYPFNADPLELNTSLPATALMVKDIHATGGTPLVRRCLEMLRRNKLTRAIIFSDGQYDEYTADELIFVAKEQKIPIDTVYIASSSSDYAGEADMKEIAERTGGIFLRFEAGKSNFRNSFKYLAPSYRAMLMAPGFKDKVERGEV